MISLALKLILIIVLHLFIGIIIGYNLGFQRGKKRGRESGFNEAPILILEKSLENGYCKLCKQKIKNKN